MTVTKGAKMNIDSHITSIRRLAEKISRPVRLMEVCGTHTVTAFRSGLRTLLPDGVSLLAGPGCPVCVTPGKYIDWIIAVAQQPDTVVATFGDMVRVPGTETSLEKVRALGAGLRLVYSPVDALNEAARNPDTRIVFFGIGFETTAPTVAWTIREAARRGLNNYSVLCAHKTMPVAMAGLLSGGEVRIDGYMCPGHVSVIIGARAFDFISREYKKPCVVAGFEPGDMALAIEMLLRQLAENRAEVEIEYRRSVGREGNPEALAAIDEIFEECEAEWRGLGTIPRSGLKIREKFAAHDASKLFSDIEPAASAENPGCICGDVIRGARTPHDCPLFRKVCTPASPVGACMVSGEGTCSTYYKYAGLEDRQGKL